jgi:Fe-S cluster assembly protein SufD
MTKTTQPMQNQTITMALFEQTINQHSDFLESLRHTFLNEERKTLFRNLKQKVFRPKKMKNTNTPI